MNSINSQDLGFGTYCWLLSNKKSSAYVRALRDEAQRFGGEINVIEDLVNNAAIKWSEEAGCSLPTALFMISFVSRNLNNVSIDDATSSLPPVADVFEMLSKDLGT